MSILNDIAAGATATVPNTSLGGINTNPFSYNTQNSSSSSSSGSSSTELLPDWYLNAGKGSAGVFNQYLGNLPGGGYTGDRVAGLTPEQLAGISQGSDYIGSSIPLYGQGIDYMNQGGNLMANSGVWNEAEMMRHLNPYLGGALNTMAELTNTNLMENVMPGVNSTFTGAGHFGSTRNADFLNRAIRENQNTIAQTGATMINQGYDNAAKDYFNWGQQGLQAGGALSQLGQNMGQYGVTGLNTGMNLGALQQAQQQKLLDANKAQWQENYSFPLDIYNNLASGFNTSVGRLTNQGRSSSSQSSSSSSGGSSFSF